MRFYWIRDKTRQNHFHIFWEEKKKNLSDYFTKHHLLWHDIAMRPKYYKATKKTKKTRKTSEMGPTEGVLELPIPGEPGNRIIPFRGPGIQFPGTRIIPLREYGI